MKIQLQFSIKKSEPAKIGIRRLHSLKNQTQTRKVQLVQQDQTETDKPGVFKGLLLQCAVRTKA